MENFSAPHQTPPRIVATTRPKWPFIIIFGILLLLIPAGIFVYGKTHQKQEIPLEKVVETPTPSPSPSPVLNYKDFESKKIDKLDLLGFTLSYPDTWLLREERNDKKNTTTINLVKGDYAIVISQSDKEGGPCAFKDTVAPEGETKFIDNQDKEFIELSTELGTLRRTQEDISGEIGYSFCQKKDVKGEDWKFWAPTDIGAVSYGGPSKWTDGVLSEMDSIIKSIKPLKDEK